MIVKLSKPFENASYVMPLLLKHYELTCAGKRGVYALEFDIKGKKHYCFKLLRNAFYPILKTVRKDLKELTKGL